MLYLLILYLFAFYFFFKNNIYFDKQKMYELNILFNARL
jgi:hypothetical protein